jgi:hypothetical protein
VNRTNGQALNANTTTELLDVKNSKEPHSYEKSTVPGHPRRFYF